MGRFLKAEKERQTKVKRTSPYFAGAREDGIYRGKSRPFCLPDSQAEVNLFQEIRQAAIDYFTRHEIKWHHGENRMPSNHLCDSQVSCVNFLFPFADKHDALVELFRPIFPTIQRVLPMEEEGMYLSFEWIGKANYLNEKVRHGGKRTRGANFTSADAALLFERKDGICQIALIEWKYTEQYRGTSLKVSRRGTDRTRIYAPLYEREDCPLNKALLPCFNALFYEPFYQLMRQQLLAHEMECARELGADIVSVLHIAPASNHDFQKVTSPALGPLAASVTEVWKRLVHSKDRFASVTTEELFGRFPVKDFSELKQWWSYIKERYSWVLG
ncbi:MAG: hypothetical protein AMS15_05720 [Planctomycetes bacterium DG_23]|nr:MAG: hypothetical protein AMS15_05720 [Planctomycetes bacterium DG_23]